MSIDADNRQSLIKSAVASVAQRARLQDLSRWLLAARCAGCEAPLAMLTQPDAPPYPTPTRQEHLPSWCPTCLRALVWNDNQSSMPTVWLNDGVPMQAWRWHGVDYVDPIPAVVASMKFGHQLWAARALAELITASHPQRPPIDALVPVPLGLQRLRERGFNQAQLLAEHLASEWQCDMWPTALIRNVNTQAQSRLNKAAREDNMAKAFAVHPRTRTRLQGLRIGLVDDVYTTGATLQAAASTLLQAGCASIGLITAARTP